jgi:hypothetical protein
MTDSMRRAIAVLILVCGAGALLKMGPLSTRHRTVIGRPGDCG